MKETTKKLRSLHTHMAQTIDHLKSVLPKQKRGHEANTVYDAYAITAECAGYLLDIILDMEKLQKS